MYFALLFMHSWLRWIIFSALLLIIIRGIYAYFSKDSYNKIDNVTAVVLLASTHIQVLIGLLLYFLFSPFTIHPMSEGMMQSPVIKYWKFEHIGIMLIFLIVVQSGRIISKKVSNDANKHRMTLLFSLLAFVILMFGMPWPNKSYGRPLFRAENTAEIKHNQLFL